MSEEVTLPIEKLVYGGDGLARLEGRVVFTPFVLPGETVRASVDRVKNDLWRGKLIQVVHSAASRVAPICPYFGRCGGCQYQHASYEQQLEQKAAILREVLRRVGKIEYAGEIETIAGEPWRYRNRVQLHVDNGSVGYFEPGSHKLCAIDHCPIASPKLNEAIDRLSRELRNARPFQADLELFTNETEVQVNVSGRVAPSVRAIFNSIGVRDALRYGAFRVSRNSFFQVNRFLVDRLASCACGGLSGVTAIDLFAGVGLFARSLAETFQNVIAVESGFSAFQDLLVNTPAQAVQQPVEEYLPTVTEAPDLIVADPPRAGLGKHLVAELLRIQAPSVVLVSCDPATLARDLQALLASYRIERISLVDLFPQTAHLETVVRLEKH
ncbi:MAG TPA: class I SAM-dependent RNA methyltransferase [Bryobacteraceae bacterium]|nr:class I SAM-dependent RNA methyltransferase [Bryobacteraceae bacterium]